MQKSLFDPQAAQDLEKRLSNLSADAQPQWGKMNASQMLNHCASQMEIALSKKPMKVNFLFRFFGKYIKKNILSGKPTKKNSPTAKELLPVNTQSFEQEKAKLIALLHEMIQREQSLQGAEHPLFGTMSSNEYGRITWNHLDYHFGQFGV